MNKKLIKNFRFKSHTYATPNQPWMCGNRENPCELGPNPKGKCAVTFECRPVKKGDRWICNRARRGSDKAACSSGPSPSGVCGCAIAKCTPRPSLSLCLSRANWFVFTIVVTVILVAFSHPRGGYFASPGPLIQAHSHGESECQMCHAQSGTGAPLNWFTISTNASHANMAHLNCVKCHDYGPNALNPHSLATSELVAARDARPRQHKDSLHESSSAGVRLDLLRTAFHAFSSQGSETEIACARCHMEHQGRFHDLTKMSSTQCQVCHETAFQSFGNGHPNFGNYPFTESSRIIFNHQSHFEEHFEKSGEAGKTAASCLTCHAVDERGERVGVRPFSRSCAQCHEDEVHTNDPEGARIPIVRVPFLDIDTLESEGEAVGAWPDDWDSLETTFSPATLLLLSATTPKETLKAFWQTDVDILEDADLSQTSQLLWSFKELLGGLRTNGVTEITQRLSMALDRPLTPKEQKELENAFPRQAIEELVDAWFPDVISELSQHALGEAPIAGFMEEMEDRLNFDTMPLSHGWIRSDVDFTLYYQPTRHEDTFIKLLLEASLKHEALGRPLFLEIAGHANAPKAGRCTKCHSESTAPKKELHWAAKRYNSTDRPFTKFSHVAHFRNIGMLDNKGCYSCHALNKQENSKAFLESFHYFNDQPSANFIGNFSAIEKNTCVECHSPRHAGDNCLMCHNYHVGEFPTALQQSDLMQSIIRQSK
jgi:hypothetical protein